MQKKSAYSSAVIILSDRDHSEFSLINKLKQRGFGIEEINKSIIKLKSLSLFSQDNYKKSKIKQLMNKNFSKSYIIQKLRSEQIHATEYDIEDIFHENNTCEIDQVNILIKKKYDLLKDKIEQGPEKLIKKIQFYLNSKGHNPNNYREMIKNHI